MLTILSAFGTPPKAIKFALVIRELANHLSNNPYGDGYAAIWVVKLLLRSLHE